MIDSNSCRDTDTIENEVVLIIDIIISLDTLDLKI